MNILDMLASVGVTPTVLQLLIVGLFATLIIGIIILTYWQQILLGVGVAACLFVFSMPSAKVIDSPKVTPVGVDVVPPEFIEDCIKFNDNATKASCEKLWKEEGNGND
jgi:hypothetical protein